MFLKFLHKRYHAILNESLFISLFFKAIFAAVFFSEKKITSHLKHEKKYLSSFLVF